MFKFDIEKNDNSLENKKIVQIKKIKEMSKKTDNEIGTNFIISICSFDSDCIHSLSCKEEICPYKISKNYYYSNRQSSNLARRHKKAEIFNLFGKDAEFFEENLINEKKVLTDDEILNLIKKTNYDFKNIFVYNYVKNEEKYNQNIIKTIKTSLSLHQSKEINPKILEIYLKSYKNNNINLLNKNFKNFERIVLKEIINNIDIPLEESKTLLLINKSLERLQKDNIFSITGDKIIFDITFLSIILKSFESQELLEMLKKGNVSNLINYPDDLFLSKLEVDKNEIKILKKEYKLNNYYFICNNVKEVENYKKIIFDFLECENNYLNEEILYSEFRKYNLQHSSGYVSKELKLNFGKYYPKLKLESNIIKNFINQEMVKVLSNFKEYKLSKEIEKIKEVENNKIKNEIKKISNDISF